MADADPYETLGVKRDATEAQIRAAYRKLAKKFHPDLNPGDKAAEERFKTLSSANELLSDTEKRARFDRGEIDASGQERPERQFYRGYADQPGGGKYSGFSRGPHGPDGMTEDDLGDLFSDLFRKQGGGGAGGPRMRMRGQDRMYVLPVPFLMAVNGGNQRLTLPEGGTLDVKVPPGIESGQVLRLRGRGGPGMNGGPAGDALIELSVEPHRFFRREGRDIHLDLPVSLAEAVLGGKVAAPTPGGQVMLTVQPHSDSGTKLRLRGRGLPAQGDTPPGDCYVTLRVVLGPADPALDEFLTSHPSTGFDPRQGMEAA